MSCIKAAREKIETSQKFMGDEEKAFRMEIFFNNRKSISNSHIKFKSLMHICWLILDCVNKFNVVCCERLNEHINSFTVRWNKIARIMLKAFIELFIKLIKFQLERAHAGNFKLETKGRRIRLSSCAFSDTIRVMFRLSILNANDLLSA